MNIKRKIKADQVVFNNYVIDYEFLENYDSNVLLFLLPPNPFYGGSMYESLFNYIFKEFYDKNISVVRFSFLSVKTETKDNLSNFSVQASLVIEAIKCHMSVCSDNLLSISLCGLSTGGIVGLNLYNRRTDIDNLFMVSPLVHEVDLQELELLDDTLVNMHMYWGGKDALVSSNKYELLINALPGLSSHYIENANHLMVGHEKEVTRHMFETLSEFM